MAVSPPIFLSYGRPDRHWAHCLASMLWHERIECYNYMAKPIEDRGVAEIENHKAYIPSALIFIALISNHYMRDAVLEELQLAELFAVKVPGHQKRFYIFIDNTIFNQPMTLIAPDLILKWEDLARCGQIALELIGAIDPNTLERCKGGWEINKKMFPDAWRQLDTIYNRPDPPESYKLFSDPKKT